MGDALKDEGIASWNIEYRRLRQNGSGWPGTYLDVRRAIDHLRQLATQYDLDLTRVVVVGHSAGGHLAMWSGTRHRLPPESAVHIPNPLPLRSVVNLAGTLVLGLRATSSASYPGNDAELFFPCALSRYFTLASKCGIFSMLASSEGACELRRTGS